MFSVKTAEFILLNSAEHLMNQLENAYRLNRVTRGDPRVVVAVLDGPVDSSHQSLATAELRDLSVGCNANQQSVTAASHGTFVCSIIFGQGPGGVNGIAPNCRGIVIPIFRDGPAEGTILPCSQVELAVAIDRAVTAGANIVNISGGQYSASGTVHPILKRVIDRAAEAGVLIVSATGNDACPCHHIPSAYRTVLAVGAHDRNGNALESSNWGERYRKNGVVALGENVFGAVPGGTRHGSGTSFATPIVSGVAALLMSCQLKAGRPVNGEQVQQAIISSAHRCFESTESCQRMLAGKLNPLGALTSLIEESQLMTNDIEQSQNTITPGALSPNGNLGSSETTPATEMITPAGKIPAESSAALHPSSASSDPTPAQSTSMDNRSPNEMMASDPMQTSITASSASQAGIKPSDCGCGCSSKGPLVYVIGEIGYDFGSEARRDSMTAHMIAGGFGEIPENEEKFAKYMKKNPWDSGAVIWTITLNNVPVYAVKPDGPYAAEAYKKLVEFLDDNHKRGRLSNHVAIPGRIVGQATLLRTCGQTVPVIQPEIRGMAHWDTKELVDAVVKPKDAKLKPSLTKILEKIYYEHQNLGIRPQDRAINYAASNTTELKKMLEEALTNEAGTMFFDNIECEPSEICRPGSECWIIKVNFFVHDQTDRSRLMFRFSVDVSDVVPVSLSDRMDWYVR